MKISLIAALLGGAYLIIAAIAFVKGVESWGFFLLGASVVTNSTAYICHAIERGKS